VGFAYIVHFTSDRFLPPTVNEIRFHNKVFHHLSSEDEQKFYGFVTTWVINYMFSFWGELTL